MQWITYKIRIKHVICHDPLSCDDPETQAGKGVSKLQHFDRLFESVFCGKKVKVEVQTDGKELLS